LAIVWFLMSRARSRSASNSGSRLGRLPLALGEAGSAWPAILQVGVGQRVLDARLEGRGRSIASARSGSPIGGQPPMPASTSATWRKARRYEPSRLQLARHVHQAAEIASEQRVGAGGGDIASILADHRVRDRRILHAEGAAEAAADFPRLHFAEGEPVDTFEQLARLFLDAELAQARAGIVIGDAAPSKRAATRFFTPSTSTRNDMSSWLRRREPSARRPSAGSSSKRPG
jgi:hypothetical protein